MTQNEHNRRIDCIEFPVADVAVGRRSYGSVFGWEFADCGPAYTSFTDSRFGGGFRGGDADELAVGSDPSAQG